MSAPARALALACSLALLSTGFNSHSTSAAAPGNTASSSTSTTTAPAEASSSQPDADLFDRARVVPCSPTSYNGTLLGDDSCIIQTGRSWVSGATDGATVVWAPTESDCCAACRARKAPNARAPPEKACVFTYCDVGPGLNVSGSCDDGLGGKMYDGECRMALLSLPLGAQRPPEDLSGFPPASAGIFSGAPASSSLLPLKSAAPPRGYRVVGPVRIPGAFNGGCDYSTDELLRRSVSKPECVANVSTVDAGARICSRLKGCTGVSW